MKYVIDRIENEIAILEELNTKEKIEVEVSKLPNEIKEGIVLKKEENFIIDTEETLSREEDISERFKKLFK
ncbi:MAG: DUF3006 domain-containing protein [Bacilli bacterium]|nr:DUF3006 domain-containing protein [Bacilli bacterium]